MRKKIKIVMTLVVRNEEDIIRENIEFHISQGVSFFIVTDHLSVDGSAEILKAYEDKGILRYFFERSEKFDQHKWVTRMAVLAFTEYGADWVINNDADEFWWPRSGSLIDTFKKIPKRFNVLEAERTNFVMIESNIFPFYKRMIYRELSSLNSLGRPLPAKVAHRGNADVIAAPGNHQVSGFHEIKMKRGVVDILHFPMRLYTQFENKIRFGGEAYERNVSLPVNIGSTFRHLYSQLRKNNGLHEYCDQNTYDAKRILEELECGKIIKDNRLSNYLDRL